MTVIEEEEGPVDTYWGIYLVEESASLRYRVTSCAAQQGVPDPEPWMFMHRWQWASTPGWAAAYEYALNTGNLDPGKDPAVITDLMILGRVQELLQIGPA